MATEGDNTAKNDPQLPWDSITPPAASPEAPATPMAEPAPNSQGRSVQMAFDTGDAQGNAAEPDNDVSGHAIASPPTAIVNHSVSYAVAPLPPQPLLPAPLAASVSLTCVPPQAAQPIVSTPTSHLGYGGWTIPILCLGICILACCLVIPQVEVNRRMVYERERLRTDLDQIDRQIAVNKEFLAKLWEDPTLAERMARRQMKLVRPGTSILDVPGQSSSDLSPYPMVTLPPPPPMPAYQPVGGILGPIFRHPRLHLYLTGAGLFLVAAGLVMGYTPKKSE